VPRRRPQAQRHWGTSVPIPTSKAAQNGSSAYISAAAIRRSRSAETPAMRAPWPLVLGIAPSYVRVRRDGAGAERSRHRVRRRQPGSSFEGLHESVINYGNPPNKMPEFITALHEESAVTMAHGYGKATGKPMCALLHGTIGVQHGAMSIYQAYYDRTPVLLIAGRDLGFIAAHSALTWREWCAASRSGTHSRRRSRNR
jgi:hypothetical protein